MTMAEARMSDFPLFGLGLVVLPGELVPLHIFEERYKLMIGRCLESETEFGIVWLSDDEPRPVGCACAVERVVERSQDGRLNILTRGTRPFRVLEQQDHLPYPAGTVTFLEDVEDPPAPEVADQAREVYVELVEEATDRRIEPDELARMSAYEMAATVDFGADAKQGLLELRSESARMRLVTRLLRAAMKRLELAERAQARARSNGKVRF